MVCITAYPLDQSATLEHTWRPAELRDAELIFAERTFRIRKPFLLVARIDRGYLLNGEIILTELKTRNIAQTYLSDVIELSAQKLAVEGETGYRVSDYAYVLTQDPNTNRRHAHKVRLLSRDELVTLADRRSAILEGRDEPSYADAKGLCRKCVYRNHCKPELSVYKLTLNS